MKKFDLSPKRPTEPLPSSDSARDVIDGKPGAILTATGHAAGRACLIGLGMYALGGIRDTDTLFRGAVGGSLLIEGAALGYFYWQKKRG